MSFQTPALPYAYDAFAPYIDASTMRIHHDKHHVTYTTKLNEALQESPLKYQNRRPEYVQAFFNVINSSQVAENLKTAR